MNRILKTTFVLALAAIFFVSCSTTKIFFSPDEKEAVQKESSVTVKTKTGDLMKVRRPEFVEGNLRGLTGSHLPVSIAIESIESISVERNDFYYTILGAGILAVELALLIRSSSAPPRPPVGSMSSCPLMYSYDGSSYVLEAEPYGGAISRALERTEWIPLEHLHVVDGQYRLRMANELAETEFPDELKLVVVDHKPGLRILPDASGRLHAIGSLVVPRRAVDGTGRDLTSELSDRDGRFWQSQGFGPDAEGIAPRDEIILEFPKPAAARTAKLVADAWTTREGGMAAESLLGYLGRDINSFFQDVDAHGPAYGKLMNWYAREEFYLLQVQVETASGWKPRGVVFGGGPFVAKEKVCVLDVSDISGETLRLRLRPPAGFWRFDRLAMNYEEDPLFVACEIEAAIARDGAGRDVRRPLAAKDGLFHEMPSGCDPVDLIFPVPPVAAGLERSVILKAAGYYRIHFAADGNPQPEIFNRILTEPGFSLRLAQDEFRKKGRPIHDAP